MHTSKLRKQLTIGLRTILLCLGLVALAACGSSDAESSATVEGSETDAAASGDEQATADQSTGEDADQAEATEGQATEEAAEDDFQPDDCDYSTFVYTPFTEIPADWPAAFPAPESLEEIKGDVGVGCERVTIDMRSRFYGSSRDWLAAYGDQLSAAGFELDEEYDELGDVILTYRSGQDWISVGGPIEREGADGEYMAVGIVLTDFPN